MRRQQWTSDENKRHSLLHLALNAGPDHLQRATGGHGADLVAAFTERGHAITAVPSFLGRALGLDAFEIFLGVKGEDFFFGCRSGFDLADISGGSRQCHRKQADLLKLLDEARNHDELMRASLCVRVGDMVANGLDANVRVSGPQRSRAAIVPAVDGIPKVASLVAKRSRGGRKASRQSADSTSCRLKGFECGSHLYSGLMVVEWRRPAQSIEAVAPLMAARREARHLVSCISFDNVARPKALAEDNEPQKSCSHSRSRNDGINGGKQHGIT
jgi:hypothetical protein